MKKWLQQIMNKKVRVKEKLDKDYFIQLFKNAVQDIYPQIKEKYKMESIYGISFEIANTVCKVYAEDFKTYIYLNTEESYQAAIKGRNENEKNYFRFGAWAEWMIETANTRLFKKLQDYLKETCANNDEEFKQIRHWQAEALGQLRIEGFWEKQDNPNIYVIPFAGENEISVNELVETYKEIDRGYHGDEYFAYLEENY